VKSVIYFDTHEQPELGMVGGKAWSLIKMTQAGFPVPAGFVLTIEFFQSWIQEIQASPEWAVVLASSKSDLKCGCDAVVEKCMRLKLSKEQTQELNQAVDRLANRHNSLFAVRSSSPEEDLEEASFAGGYHTSLGVTIENLEEAVRRSFASSFDERVFVYKREQGFEIDKPSIAVIVQEQVCSDISGVAFSLNPLNNSYDEAVINANFGLGESVVSGIVTPDTYIVDKVSRRLLDKKLGSKEISLYIGLDGGMVEAHNNVLENWTLNDEEVCKITDVLVEVEELYSKPVDIEWTLDDGTLYVLQARPITAYFPLPPQLVTSPGERKILYGDLSLLKWGMQEPLTVLGTEILAKFNQKMMEFTISPDVSEEFTNVFRITLEGRTYINASASVKLWGRKRAVDMFREMDVLAAEIIENIDEEYILPELPPSLKGVVFKMVRKNIGLLLQSLQAYRNPVEYKRTLEDTKEKLLIDLTEAAEKELAYHDYINQLVDIVFYNYLPYAMPVIMASELTRPRLRKLFGKEPDHVREKVNLLERALPGNITIEMGLTMYHLSQYPEVKECPDGKTFARMLEKRSFSPGFMQALDGFFERFGFRSPMEMDVGAARMYERPEVFFGQLHSLSENTDIDNNPEAIFMKAREQREQAYRELLQNVQAKSRRRAKNFKKFYTTLIELSGYREEPKYFVGLLTDLLRKRALKIGAGFVRDGRLDSVDQIFDLKIDEIDRGLKDSGLDLRVLTKNNTHFLNRFRKVREMPRLIDSRGKIIRSPVSEAEEGTIIGEPISAGVVSGRVKVLHKPDEKQVLPGEILVARATDPGWTPLFLNAAGVILEVGGMLQHGALVAREYGKPCVAGIESATHEFEDGRMVEVDGTNGVVRYLDSVLDRDKE
jgi:pyruvate,water dikinase